MKNKILSLLFCTQSARFSWKCFGFFLFYMNVHGYYVEEYLIFFIFYTWMSPVVHSQQWHQPLIGLRILFLLTYYQRKKLRRRGKENSTQPWHVRLKQSFDLLRRIFDSMSLMDIGRNHSPSLWTWPGVVDIVLPCETKKCDTKSLRRFSL